ncbi:HlyD family efflux transporter periplasmic adaptor subunit [Sphingomonas sp. LR60]|uniref:HlyD family secretion protein n=1 Tax=Sphingomonas sp. LR60 TaxID=3050233 RepID=UPI002FE1E9CF
MTEQKMGASAPSGTGSGAAMDRRVAQKPKRWWRQRGVLIVVAIALVAVAAWWMLPAAGSTDISARDVDTGEVTRAAFDDYLPVRATVAPRLATLVGVLSGGQVEKLLAQDGAMVVEGQPLAMLANPTLKLDVLTREAQIASQLGGIASEGMGIERNRLDRAAQVSQAEYDLIKARRDLGIRQQLHDKGFLSDAGVKSFEEEAAYQERRLAQLRNGRATEARITSTQSARLDETQSRLAGNLSAVRAGLSTLTVRAPAGGRLTNFTLQPGQTLKPGDPAGQVDSEGSWKLEADVDEFFLGRVAVGQKAKTADGVLMTVSKVLPAVKEGRFRVELTFDRAPPAGLNRGQTLDLRITLGAASNAVVAPVGGWLESGAAIRPSFSTRTARMPAAARSGPAAAIPNRWKSCPASIPASASSPATPRP